MNEVTYRCQICRWPAGIQHQDGDRRHAGGQVADHHHQLAVGAIDDGAGDGAEGDHGRDKEKADQGQGSGLPGHLVGPDGQAKAAHAGAEQRDGLTQPDDDKSRACRPVEIYST